MTDTAKKHDDASMSHVLPQAGSYEFESVYDELCSHQSSKVCTLDVLPVEANGEKNQEDTEKGKASDPLKSARSGRDGAGKSSLSSNKKQQGPPISSPLSNVRFHDHFSLKTPSSTVRFRGSHVRVYEQRNAQFLIEEKELCYDDDDNKSSSNNNKRILTVKHMTDTSAGLRGLRACYTLVVVFMSGFLFIFCFQILLFLFLDAVTEMGATSKQDLEVWPFLGTALSIPIFVHGFSSAIAIAGGFVADTWNGHPFLRSMGSWDVVITEWIAFLIFLGIPIFTVAVTLLAGSENWWQISSLTWYSCVFVFYGYFAFAIMYYEIQACFDLAEQLDQSRYVGRVGHGMGFKGLIRRAIFLRQVHRLSGVRHSMYLVGGHHGKLPLDSYSLSDDYEAHRETMGLYTKMTLRPRFERFFTVLDPPIRVYSVDEARGISPFITSNTWTLEKIYCRHRKDRAITVVSGPSAISTHQAKSSFACAIIGNFLAFLLVLGFLVWMDFSGVVVGILVAVMFLCFLPHFLTSAKIFKMYRHVKEVKMEILDQENDAEENREQHQQSWDERENDSDDMENPIVNNATNSDDEESEGIYQVWETFRVTRPRDEVCWIIFGIELALFFVWPVITLFAIKNYATATLFVFVSIFSGTRHYLNAAVVLKELGAVDVMGSKRMKDTEEQWKAKARLSKIVGNVSRGRSRNLWIAVFYLMVILLFAISILSIGVESDSTASTEQIEMLPDFYYEGSSSLPYPTCRMRKGLEIPGRTGRLNESTAMADYAFLSTIAYMDTSITQSQLNEWFGDGVASDQQGIVDEFRALIDGGSSAVSYKLISFPGIGGFAVVAIRGTSNAIDMLTDGQLWSAAALAQFLRLLLPVGEVWTNILNNLVRAVSLLQSESLDRISFYKQTTEFVEWLRTSTNYTSIQITGHSLGGGLAMITGAQTGTPAVAISGPNAMISRLTFKPPLTIEQLNTGVFNVVPNRDPIPMIDDLARLYQRIECRAPANSFFDCHSIQRTLCEIVYTCGTDTRPALCSCVTKYGYPEPSPSGNRSFAQACHQA